MQESQGEMFERGRRGSVFAVREHGKRVRVPKREAQGTKTTTIKVKACFLINYFQIWSDY
jgi:hypothetical protein